MKSHKFKSQVSRFKSILLSLVPCSLPLKHGTQASRLRRHILHFSLFTFHFSLLISCQTSTNIPDGDQLYIGLKTIKYQRDDQQEKTKAIQQNYIAMQQEVEAALAAAPNGAIFGSSYHRSPFPYRLWIWNTFAQRDNKTAQYLAKTLGKPPVFITNVNPALRAQVAQSVIRNHGYFNGSVDYDIIPNHKNNKAKISYTVNTGALLTLDSIQYDRFPLQADSLINTSMAQAQIKKGDPLAATSLAAERTRIATLLRNNGYYNYQPAYATYLADTTTAKTQLRLQLADSLPLNALQKYTIGRVTVNLRKTFSEQLKDTFHLPSRRAFRSQQTAFQSSLFTFHYNARRPPVRPRVVLRALNLRPRQTYSYQNQLLTASSLNATSLFSMTDFQFQPRQDTLDLTIDCLFNPPYDLYLETNITQRTIGRTGPQAKIGLTRRNLFRGGEKFDANLHGTYQWQSHSHGTDMNTYEYGADASLQFPRIIAPFFSNTRHRQRIEKAPAAGIRPTPNAQHLTSNATTIAKISSDIIRRPQYYKMHIVAAEWTYQWQHQTPGTQHSLPIFGRAGGVSQHQFSPLHLKYQFINSSTAKFDSIQVENPYIAATMSDYFIPQIKYTYTYTSPATMLNPVRWEITLSEAGNITSLAQLAAGKKWDQTQKKLFKNPYAQFLRLETDFTKTWQLRQNTTLVAHLAAGIGYSYGNATELPFTERFYVGGANTIRAFPLRTIGPGKFPALGRQNRQFAYYLQNGDIKLLANLEYRQPLFGNLHAAAFIDAGNVWLLKGIQTGIPELDEIFSYTKFKPHNFIEQCAVGTGAGLRYNLQFLVIRLDWGIALHLPFDTDRSGFYNVDSFGRYQTLHFAIGYPF